MDYYAYFKNKKITVMGLGLLGRGVGDIKFLAECGAKLIVTDLKTEEELKSSLGKLRAYDISYTLGKHELEDFRNCDMVLKAAGVPLNSAFIEEARKNNIPVKMSTSLFAEISPATIVGVTGTRGKSTVAAMIVEVLKTAGKKTFFGGNVRGVSTLAHLPESSADEIAVLELDSWQLQGFGESSLSPHIAVFTTFMPDHMNYYSGDMNKYLNDKANIFKFQKEEDVLVLGKQCASIVKEKYSSIKSKIIETNSGDMPYKLKIPGEHNLYNAALAAEALRALKIDEELIKEGLENFNGLEGRLEFVKEVNGVKIYNDNNSTTPEATIVALKALASGHNKNIILIMGGSDKRLDFTELLKVLPNFCKAVILLPGTGTEKLVTSHKLQVTSLNSSDIKEAVQKSVDIAEEGDIILFSPAFASFGPPPVGFKNEFDRGDQFLELVKNLPV